MNEIENMALVQQMPVETNVHQWIAPMARIMPTPRGGYTTLEHIAAFFSNSPTGALSNQSTTDDWMSSPNLVGSSRGELRKARSFPKVKHDEPKKPCILAERQTLRKSKSVRFADSQGLPLAAVHPLTSADSSYTSNIIVPYDDDDAFGDIAPTRRGRPDIQRSSLHVTAVCTQQLSYVPSSNVRRFNFAQPGTEPDFFDRVRSQKVCLESLRSERRTLHGVVRVSNIAYEKSVSVRWTVDKWQNCHESRATYIPCSSDGQTDSFAFEMPVNGEDVEFAIRYQCNGQEHWDNNKGRNYVVCSTLQNE